MTIPRRIQEDDDENSGRSRAAKRAPARKRTGLRLLFWARNVVTKSDSAKDAERAKEQTAANPLEVENLAEIIEDFKMVLVVRNDLEMGKGKIAAQCRLFKLEWMTTVLQRCSLSQTPTILSYLSVTITSITARFININMNVGNARTTYIMKRRKYILCLAFHLLPPFHNVSHSSISHNHIDGNESK
uniref:peptidyl-tRNA hydrolase n=1 Tax=Oryza barthii TaxID=65489 RepID=A0A0D3HWI3_9ORYZ